MIYKLGDLVNISHGYPFKSNTFSDTPTKFVILTPGNIKIGGGFQFGKGKYLRENTKFPEKYMLEPGTIFLNMTDLSKQGDTLGYPAIVPDSGYTFLHNQRLGVISIKDDKDSVIDLYYLFYALRIREYHHFILGSATGTTVRHTSPKKIMDYEISLPSINIQRKISYMLHKIEEKIHLNNQIISNLEELSSTLFKRWFVDFEFPDENGNPYKSSGGKMVDSELGEIPEGWEVTNLEEISIDIITGKTPNTKQKENYGEDIPFIKIPDMHNNTYIVQTETYLSKKGSDSQYKKLLPKDSICVSCIATPGLVSITSVASHTNQQINTILPKVEDLYFLYLDLKRKRNLIRELGSGGSTTLNLNKTQFGKINIINCGKREKMNFNKICEPLFSKILLLQKSNIYLAKLRDSLLPKLLSGEIELPEDEEV